MPVILFITLNTIEMAKKMLPNEDDYQDERNYDEDSDALMDKESMKMFEDEGDLRKEINKLKRWDKKIREQYDTEISRLRLQIRELFEKNFDLTEANHIFAKGLEQLRQDNRVVTTSHIHHVIDRESIKKYIDDLTKPPAFGTDKKMRIVSTAVIKSDSRSQATEILIVTEHIEKLKKKEDKDE